VSITSINPATGALLKHFDEPGASEVAAAVAQGRTAQAEWATESPERRAQLFANLQSVISRRTDEILTLMWEETGKVRPDAEAEVFDIIDAIPYYLGKAAEFRPDTSLKLNSEAFPDTELVIDTEPFGVVALIMPWNFPFYSPGMFVITNTIAGNSVILKPSEYSTLMGFMIRDLFIEAGFPEMLVQVLPGAEDVGKQLVKSGVDKIFFVGSVKAGQDIIANAGITPVQVELGGNSAALVLGDADIDLAAQGVAWAATYHSGQDCVGVKRVFVDETIADGFIEAVVRIVSNLRPGIDYGPYITQEAAREVKARIEQTVASGAKLLCGGEWSSPGNWLSPSVILMEDQSNELVRRETFGNVVPIMVVRSTEEAVQQANSTNYGLSNSVFTRDQSIALAIARRLQSGMVFINEPFIAIPGWDHWTGWKDSGFGTVESKLVQCRKKKVLSVRCNAGPRSFWYPY
jgi:acyl-CoA reductase-like NAD-dependent aldehyde dehydrogenase